MEAADAPPGPAGPATAGAGKVIGRPRDPALDEAILVATRRRLVLDGYTAMTIGDIAADAGVSRPTLYRRWRTKFDLVVDALDYGLQNQLSTYPPQQPADLAPRQAFAEAVRRLDPCYANPDAIILQGGFMGEHPRAPELLEILRARAVVPRVAQFRTVASALQDDGHLRPDVDLETLATMCFGSFFGAFLRGTDGGPVLADRMADTLWRLAATNPED